MVFMERIAAATDDELVVIRLLRHYCATRGHDCRLSRFVALGQTLRFPPAGSVALASVFQLTEAVLGRNLVTECCCSRCVSGDERAVIHLLGSRMATMTCTGNPDIPDGLPGALAWAVLSVRRLCGDIVTCRSRAMTIDVAGCPFTPAVPV